MKRQRMATPIINCGIEKLLYFYIKDGLILNPDIFGLKDFSIASLSGVSFDRVGDDEFSLYEKLYRIADSSTLVDFKVYYAGSQLSSNGISVTGKKLCKVIERLPLLLQDESLLTSIELLLDNSCEYGSLIINNFLEVRFGKSGAEKKQKKFKLVGISTDHGYTEDWTRRKIATHGARAMKESIEFSHALKKFKDNIAISEITLCATKNLPRAILN